MAQKSDRISAREFSSLSRVSVSRVSRLLRQGKIKGVKESGKWMIPKSQLELKVVRELAKGRKPGSTRVKSVKVQKDPTAGKKKAAKTKKQPEQNLAVALPATPAGSQTAAKKSYSVAEFSAMSYLTDFGVKDWLKKGRLKGSKDENGQWQVDGASLELPNIKRLLRD
jgi:predicted site-specific integrase-resolvase